MTTKLEELEELKNLTEETRRFQEYVKQKGKDLLLGAVKEIFNKYPQVKKIGWVQYTPYFNDGDACYFRVGDLHAWIENPEKVEKYKAEKRTHDAHQATAKGLTEEQRNTLGVKSESWDELNQEKLCDEICIYEVSTHSTYYASDLAKYGEAWKALYQIAVWLTDEANEAMLENVFGDHVQIRITRDGVEISEFDHD